jgi:cytochrome c biogenesis protein CcmG/thiol:disulfide interchange protein DsbE
MPKTRFDWTVITILAALLGTAWIHISRVPPEGAVAADRPPAPQVGHPAPDFTLTTIEGERISLEDLRGQAVLINFWATWCGPCAAEMPDIQDVYEAYAEDGFVVLAIDDAESERIVQAYVDDLGLTFPIAIDVARDVQLSYQVRAMPTSYFIDKDGIVRQVVFGSMTRPVIEDNVEEMVR